MCDNKNNSSNNNKQKHVYKQQHRQQQIWLLKPLLQLLSLGLLIQQQQQNFVLVNATQEARATFSASHHSHIEHHGKDTSNLASASLLAQKEQQNVITFDTDVGGGVGGDLSSSTARKLFATDGGDSSRKFSESGSNVVGALTDLQDSKADTTNVDKSENDEEMDRIEFSGYVNDFNIQQEASIPEDILDQRHIDDEQQNAEGDGEQDIILESQRDSTRNFTSYNGNSENKQNHGNNNKSYNTAIGDDDADDGDDGNGSNTNNNNYKRKKKKTKNYNYNHKKLRNNKQHHHFEESFAIESDEQQQIANDDDDDDNNSGSFKNEKFKTRLQQKQMNFERQHQQPDEVVNINGPKFNKQMNVENFNDDEDDSDDDEYEDDDVLLQWNNSNENREQQQHNEKQLDAQQKAIGDIEKTNSFHNEGAWDAEIATDNEASAAGVADTIDEITDSTTTTTTTTPTTTTTKMKTITFVGRKTKRHGAAMTTQKQLQEQHRQQQQQQEPTIDIADADLPYPEEVQQILNDKQTHSWHHRYNSNNSGKNNNSNSKSVANSMPTFKDDTEQEEQKSKLLVKPDYSISYFGISTSNGSSSGKIKPDDLRVSATKEESFSTPESSSGNGSGSRGQDLVKFVNEDEVTLSQHSDYVMPTLTAFEQHKAQRRNNRRTGHKSHKKKYKDYLRYVMEGAGAGTTKTTTVLPTTHEAPKIATIESVTKQTAGVTATEEEVKKSTIQQQQQQRRLAKLQKYKNDIKSMENSRKLPTAAEAPIFVLTNRRNDGGSVGAETTIRPYYEGQLSYYMETRDDDDDIKNLQDPNVGKLITSETGNNNWYRRMQPILRNGMTKQQREDKREHKHHHQHQHYHPHEHQQKLQKHQEIQNHHHSHHGQNQQRKHHKHSHHDEQQQLQHREHSDSKSASYQKTNGYDQPTQYHAYQRRPSIGKKEPQTPYRPRFAPYSPLEIPTAPLPPPSYRGVEEHKSTSEGSLRELGHQITQMEEFDRYYRKWPHLARVQYQLNDENYRATHGGAFDGDNSETVYDYQLATDELDDEFDTEDDDVEDGDDEDVNLPPYIKKYNRRNKQLLNLLEGTLPPPTPPKRIIWSSSKLQPGPRDAAPVRIDDDYIKQKRRRFQKQHSAQWSSSSKDLFAEQRGKSISVKEAATDAGVKDATENATEMMTTTTTKSWQTQKDVPRQQQQQQASNVIPDDDVDISTSSQELNDWEKEIAASAKGSEKMKWQIEKSTVAVAASGVLATLTTTTTAATPTEATTLKPAVFRLPSYPGFAGSFIGKPRSRSSQFAPSSGSSIMSNDRSHLLPSMDGKRAGNSFINSAFHAESFKSAKEAHEGNSYTANKVPPTSAPSIPSVTVGAAAVKPFSNSFVYHRVEAAPRFVGAGSTGHKQRLPFVAITDRRLETAKKSSTLLDLQRDFEQNHYPMP